VAEELNKRIIGFIINRRRGDFYLYHAAGRASNLILRRIGNDLHRQFCLWHSDT